MEYNETKSIDLEENYMKKLTALLLAVLMMFTLAACRNGQAVEEDTPSVAGTYVLTGVLENGAEVDAATLPEFLFDRSQYLI